MEHYMFTYTTQLLIEDISGVEMGNVNEKKKIVNMLSSKDNVQSRVNK